MVLTHPKNRRSALRLNIRMRLRFSVDNGSFEDGETADFTARSMAIRARRAVQPGERIQVSISDLPLIDGVVVRIYPGGFAIRLDEASINLVAHAVTDGEPGEDGLPAPQTQARLFSGPFPLQADYRAWGRLVTARDSAAVSRRHSFSILLATPTPLSSIRGVWLHVGEARWVARVLSATARGRQLILVLHLNDWQLRFAAEDGFSIVVNFADDPSLTITGKARFAASHLNALERESAEALTA